MPTPPKDLSATNSLVEIVADLRGPDGCPWDKEQTHSSLTPYAVEEVAELVEAIESGDDAKTKEELGDVLFQVVLHAQLAHERGAFNFADVVQTLNEKMVRRHPHVFSDTQAADAKAVIENWDQIKKREKAATGAPGPFTLDAPPHLPALQRSAKIGSRTRKLNFDWDNAEQVLEKVREEMAELEDAFDDGNDAELSHELGDVFFSLAQLARHLNRDPEQILREANRRFERRFSAMMGFCAQQGLEWMSLSAEQRESFWAQAKAAEKRSGSTTDAGE